MARSAQFNFVKTPAGWMVSCPKSLSKTGKRQRHFFKTRDEARDHAADLKARVKLVGENASAIRPSLAEAAVMAESLLEPWGVSIVEAARIVVDLRQREAASILLDDGVSRWLVSCEGLRPRTLKNYTITGTKLRKTLGDRMMSSILTEDLQSAIAPASGTVSTVLEQLRNAKAFWRWCAKKGWCNSEVFAAIDIPKAPSGEEITILSPTEALALLRTAEMHFPQTVAAYALQLFGGIRPEEIVRLESKHVTAEGIDLPRSVTKKGRRRHITPNETLTAWLRTYPFAPCPNWRETSAAVRRLAGWDVVSVILDHRVAAGSMNPLAESTFGRWPQNALRHSHASYAVASDVPLKDLLFEFGHVGGESLLRQHYVGRASRKLAAEYHALRPLAEKPRLESEEQA